MTEKMRAAFEGALAQAERGGNPELLPEHLAQALISDRDGIATPLLRKAGVDPAPIAREIARRLETLPSVVGGAEPRVSQRLQAVWKATEKEASALKDEYVSTEHVLLALLEDKDVGGLLRKAGVSRDAL